MGADYKPRAKQMLLANSGGVMLIPNATRYASVIGIGLMPAAEGNTRLVAPCAGVLSTLYFELNVAPGVGEQVVITLRINGNDTALTATIAGAVDLIGTDLVNQVAYAQGDMLTYSIVTSLNCNASRPHYSMVAKNA